jgi:transglutaminase-like putative cysteine protease
LGGDFYGSIAYNPFVDVRTQLNSQSDAVVFSAQLDGEVNPRNVYYRLLTLDNFNGRWWGSTAPELQPTLDGVSETQDQKYSGERVTVQQTIVIDALANSWLPAAYSPVALSSNERLVYETARVAPDGSLHIDANAYKGLTYSVTSEIPKLDLISLSAGQRGPSPLFDAAGRDGVFASGQVTASENSELPDGFDQLIELPDEVPTAVTALARNTTLGLETSFEKGVALETFFRRTGGFRYSLDVEPAAPGVPTEDWLLDPASEHYRSGYCEQFAGWMAVMARTLEIPSRVVLGFTPGTPVGNDTVVVRDRNAHAWVELWIDGFGWIPFDPTPRSDTPSTTDALPFDAAAYLEEIEATERARLAEQAGSVPLFPGDNQFDIPNPLAGGGGSDGTTSIPGWLPELIGTLVVGATLLGAIPMLKRTRRRKRLARAREGDISGMWAEIVDRLTDVDESPLPTQTPHEFAADRPKLRPLAAAYSRHTYGPQGSPSKQAMRSAVDSFEATRTELNQASLPKRVWSTYRLRSLLRR